MEYLDDVSRRLITFIPAENASGATSILVMLRPLAFSAFGQLGSNFEAIGVLKETVTGFLKHTDWRIIERVLLFLLHAGHVLLIVVLDFLFGR